MMTPQDQPLPVLLVEDNEIDIEITRRMLDRSDVDVDLSVARDGGEALDLIFGDRAEQEHLPRLVMLDLGLPHVDGQEVLRRMKSNPICSQVPVAVLTGATGERPLIECLRLGGNMYFVKPISLDDVTNLVGAVRRYWNVMEKLQRHTGGAKEAPDVDEEE